MNQTQTDGCDQTRTTATMSVGPVCVGDGDVAARALHLSARVGAWAHTVARLSAGQMAARAAKMMRRHTRRRLSSVARRMLARRAASPPHWVAEAPPVGPVLWPDEVAFDLAEQAMTRRFRFLGRSIALAVPMDWTPADADYLWRYHLHAFEYLEGLRRLVTCDASWRERALRAGQELMMDWVVHHGYPAAPGWEPYPLSLRLVFWARWLSAFPPQRTEAIRASLWSQVLVLRRNVEFDLGNNHVLENLVGLLFALSLFESRADVQRLRDWASGQLNAALRKQFSADGVLVERSAMYHSLMVSRVVQLYPLQGVACDVPVLESLLERTMARLGEYEFSDGTLAHFHDSADGVAPPADRLRRACPVSIAMADNAGQINGTGLFWQRRGVYECVVDGAGPEPRENPAHAHACIGAFLLHWKGRPVVVDPGVSTYQAGPWRAWERGTAAHNTLCVDGMDQSVMWSRFRVGRRARVVDRAVEMKGESGVSIFSLSHDGYERGGRRVRHTRRFLFSEDFFIVHDLATGHGGHSYGILLTFAPGVNVERVAPDCFHISGGAGVRLWLDAAMSDELVEATTARLFGVREQTMGLHLTAHGAVSWAGTLVFADAQRDVRVQRENGAVWIDGHCFSLDKLSGSARGLASPGIGSHVL